MKPVRFAIRPREAESDGLPEVDVIDTETGEAVARGALVAEFTVAPEPGADVGCSLRFEGMGLES